MSVIDPTPGEPVAVRRGDTDPTTFEAEFQHATQDLVLDGELRNLSVEVLDAEEVQEIANGVPYELGSPANWGFDYSAPENAPEGVGRIRWTGEMYEPDIDEWFAVGPVEEMFQVIGPEPVVPPGGTGGTCSLWATRADLPIVGVVEPFAANIDVWLKIAGDLLFLKTKQRWPGICAVTGARPGADSEGNLFWPAASTCVCQCHLIGSVCGCSWNPVQRLTWPVVSVTEVTLDGELLVAGADYEVQAKEWLVRLPDTSGNRRGWPGCQRRDLPTSSVGTWSVSFTYGQDPPHAGRLAAAELAAELARMHAPATGGGGGGDACRLSPRVQQLAREGVTLNLSDMATVLGSGGGTGLWFVDDFLDTANNAPRPAGVWAPNLDPPLYRP